jgi:methylthioribulose-1-phosphate dehydratase
MEAVLRQELAQLVRWIHSKGWALATGGNFSAVLQDEPLRLLITPSGIEKGETTPECLLIVNDQGEKLQGDGKPSAETLLHTAILAELSPKVIVHTHSIWNNLASMKNDRFYTLEGYEMLKALNGVMTHEHTEKIPILENSQDMVQLNAEVRARLQETPDCHAFLLKQHGLYTWGNSIIEARRHLEVLEWLFELNERKERMN